MKNKMKRRIAFLLTGIILFANIQILPKASAQAGTYILWEDFSQKTQGNAYSDFGGLAVASPQYAPRANGNMMLKIGANSVVNSHFAINGTQTAFGTSDYIGIYIDASLSSNPQMRFFANDWDHPTNDSFSYYTYNKEDGMSSGTGWQASLGAGFCGYLFVPHSAFSVSESVKGAINGLYRFDLNFYSGTDSEIYFDDIYIISDLQDFIDEVASAEPEQINVTMWENFNAKTTGRVFENFGGISTKNSRYIAKRENDNWLSIGANSDFNSHFAVRGPGIPFGPDSYVCFYMDASESSDPRVRFLINDWKCFTNDNFSYYTYSNGNLESGSGWQVALGSGFKGYVFVPHSAFSVSEQNNGAVNTISALDFNFYSGTDSEIFIDDICIVEDVDDAVEEFDEKNTKLQTLTVSEGKLFPPFSPDCTEYSVTVASDVTQLTVSAGAQYTQAGVLGTGVKTLASGSNNISVMVTGANEINTEEYKITVTRPMSGLITNARSLVSIKRSMLFGEAYSETMDIDGDGTVGAADIVRAKKYLLGGEAEMKQKEYIANAELWETPKLRSEGFQFSNTVFPDATTKDANLIRRSIDYYGIGEYTNLLPSQRAWEWDYAPNHMVPQIDPEKPPAYTGWGSKVTENSYLEYLYSNYTQMLQNGGPDSVGARTLNQGVTRLGALEHLKRFVQNVFKINTDSPWISNNGHYAYQHYAGEFGASVIGSEIGENIHNYQMQLAFNRGAARQYQTPWTVCFSYWHGPSATNYDVLGGGMHGHSLSLFKRSMLMCYMAGVDTFDTEAGGNNSLLPTINGEGYYELSPHGVATKEFVEFQKNNPNMGVNYTPIGIVLDYEHGVYARDGVSSNGRAAFNGFTYTAADNMTWSLMDALWPGAWSNTGNEAGVMTNNGLGDYFDALLQNAPKNILNTYRVLILSGDVRLSAQEKARYVDYVSQGGTLLLNTAYISSFPQFSAVLGSNGTAEIAYGNGKVILYGSDYQIDKLIPLIGGLIEEYVPVNVSGNIQKMVNIKDGTIYVTLINNDGVTKTTYDPPATDANKAKTVSVALTDGRILKSVREIYQNQSVLVSDNTVTVTVGAGESVVLEFKV